VIAIGGGSVLDCGKALALMLTQDHINIESCLTQKADFKSPPIPCIALPTTSGTGSEVTPYASIESSNKQKISLSHPWIYPKIALIDPEMTHSMPQYLTACTGLDALSQAIESFWAKAHNASSDAHALKAIPIIVKDLEKAFNSPNNYDARYGMSVASMEAGLAIAQTKTTAVHSVSYPITSYFGVPHGHACALTLASFIEYNEPAIESDRAKLLWNALSVTNAKDAADFVRKLLQKVKLEQSFKALGIDENKIETIVQNGFRPDRVKNNPRELTQEHLRSMLKSLL
jgi:alcohol dehydrogenase